MSFTTPDMNMKRNRSQRASQTPVVGAKLITSATIVVSKRNVSHWKFMKVCPA